MTTPSETTRSRTVRPGRRRRGGPAFRYTATLAAEIEARWQTSGRRRIRGAEPGRAAGPGGRCAGAGGQAVPAGHVPLPVRRGSARRTPAGLHRHRRDRPLHADDRPERAAHHRVRRLRAARRAVRGAHRHPPADHHRGEHRPVPGAAAPAGVRPRPAAQRRHHRSGLLPVDPVDLHPAVRGLVRRNGRPGPAHRGPGRRVHRRRPAGTPDGRPWAELSYVERHKVLAGYRLAYIDEAPVNWCPGLGTVLSNEEVTADGRSAIGNYPVFRRNLRQWMMRITAYADRLLDDLDRLDWPESVKSMQRNWIGRSYGASIAFPIASRETLPANGSEQIEVYHTPGHAVRGHLHGAGAGASAGREDHRGAVARWHRPAMDRRRGHPRGGGRRLPAGGLPQERSGKTTGRGGRRQDRCLHRCVRRQPGRFASRCRFHCRLRVDGLRHRRDHGGARSGHPGLGLRHGLRPADHPHRAAAGRPSTGPGVHRRRPGDQQRQRRDQPERAGGGRGEAGDDRLAGGRRCRRGAQAVQTAGLAVLPAALLG